VKRAPPPLLARAEATENNVRLTKIAVKAMDADDEPALRRCLEKMSNAVYVTDTLIALSRHEAFSQYTSRRAIRLPFHGVRQQSLYLSLEFL